MFFVLFTPPIFLNLPALNSQGPSASEKRLERFFFYPRRFFLQQFGAGHRSINTVQPFRVATLHDQTQGGGAMVVRDVKAPKKPYNAPSFDVIDISAAKEQL